MAVSEDKVATLHPKQPFAFLAAFCPAGPRQSHPSSFACNPGLFSSDPFRSSRLLKPSSCRRLVGWAVQQLWLFWIAPIVGGVLGGLIYRWLSEEPAGIVEGQSH